MVVFILLLITPLIIVSGLMYVTSREPQAVVSSKTPLAIKSGHSSFSAPAQQVYNEYMTLPAESRPFDNIADILKSLDAVTLHLGKDARRDHFDGNLRNRKSYRSYGYQYEHAYDGYPFKFVWQGGGKDYCLHTDCDYADYYALHETIADVKKALAEKQLAMVQSENAHNVSMAKELVAALRTEAGIQREVAKQL